MTTKGDLAAEKFASGFNCAQSVIWAFADELGLDKNLILKLATGFGGGMGHEQEVCGAVSGGVFALGAKFGRDETGTRDQTNATYQKVQELFARFRERHGTCICGELLPDCNLATPAGQQKFKDSGLRDKVCKECVRDAANFTAELLR